MNFIFILKLILMSNINQLKHFDALNYKRYLCLGIDCRAVILKQVKHEKK